MAEDDNTDKSQKTEEPTARKLEEARKKGQVVYSREINNLAVLFAVAVLTVMLAPSVMTQLKDALAQFLAMPHAMPVESPGIGNTLAGLFLKIAGILALPLLLLLAAGFFSGFLQIGPLFTTEPIKPDISKISIIKGFGRLFSGKSIAELVKGILKLVVISIVGLMVLRPYFDGAEHFVGLDFGQAMFDLQTMFVKLMIAVLSILFVVAILDYIYQRYAFMEQMRMSKQEIKAEFKQTEGDPHVKARLKQLREQRARQRMIQAVPESAVVITNPTHFAVALKYSAADMPAPVMVAKGVDTVAEKIKEVAKEHDVPIVENAPLTRALFDAMDIDDAIPQEHWKAVAEVISYAFKLKGKKV